ncbi:MAG: NMD3-related protein [Candidatus Nanoarchaeia archaeon]
MGIKTKFCAMCGIESEILLNSLCPECFFKKIKIALPKEIVLYACPLCDAVLYKGIWYESYSQHEEFFIKEILDRLKLPAGVELDDIKILQEGEEGKVELDLSIAGKRFTTIIPIGLYITDKLCARDAAKGRKSYEGILQLRGDLRKIDEIIGMLSSDKILDEILEIKQSKHGADIYFITTEALRSSVALLKRKYKFRTKESSKAYSWDRSKNRPKYKITILAMLE